MSDRSACIRYQDITTSSTPLKCGAPQGSPISPILFLLYTEPIYRLSNPKGRFGYADDTAILRTGNSLEETAEKASLQIQELVTWEAENGITFDPQKTEVMHFSPSRRVSNPIPSIRHDADEKRPESLALRWLGIWLDRRLTFQTHVEKLTAKAQAVVFHLKKLTNTRHGPLPQAIQIAIRACVEPALLYGAEAWYPGTTCPRWSQPSVSITPQTKGLIRRMEKAITQSMKAILPVWRTTPITALHRESGIPPVNLLLETRRIRFAARLKSLDEHHPLIQRITESAPPVIRKGVKLKYQIPQISFPTRLRRTNKLLPTCARPILAKQRFSEKTLQTTSKEQSAAEFQRWLESAPPLSLVVYSDGSLSPGGQAGYGFSIHQNNRPVLSGSGRLGPAEVFDAEATGALEGLKAALRLPRAAGREITVCLDNLAAASSLQGTPSDSSQDIFLKFQDLASAHGNTSVRWIPGHTNIVGNEQADALAKAGCSQPAPADALPTLAYLRKLARKQPRDAFEVWWSTAAPERYRPLKLKATIRCPKELAVPRSPLHRLLAARSHHGDFAAYHERFNHANARLACSCRRRKEPKHLFYCRKIPPHRRMRLAPSPTAAIDLAIGCREKSRKRRVVQPLDANRPSKRPDISRSPLPKSHPLLEEPARPSTLPVQRHDQPQQPIPPVQPRVLRRQHLQPLRQPPRPIQPAQCPVQLRVPEPIQLIQRHIHPRSISPRVLRQQPLQPLQPQVSRPIQPVQRPVHLQPRVTEPIQPVPRQVPQPILPAQPGVAGFLPAVQWGYIRSFHAAMDQVRMETCLRCKERWFAIDLKHNTCHACFLRDKRNQIPYLMSVENEMDPGDIPAHLPQLTQVEEMIIARCHVQMMVHRYRGHQYHYTGHCVSFMQNTVKTVDTLPNLPSELDVVVLRPSDQVMAGDSRYQRQFQSDFRVRRGRVITWLRFLKEHHPDYRYITICPSRINALPIDDDVSLSFASILDSDPSDKAQDQPVSADLPPPNSQSMVPNLNITATEIDLIIQEVTGRKLPPACLPAPSIRKTPIDEASGKDRIFAMAFPTLYPTGRADFNTPRLRKVDLNDYARHLMCFHDGRFGQHPRWRFLVFNILMRRKANSSARFYVSKASSLKDLSRDELAEALIADEGLLPYIVRQGSHLTGTRPFWNNKSNTLQALARFLSPSMSPVFVTLSAADMQWQDLHRHFPGFANLATADDRTRRTFVWDGVQKNPHIVAHYLAIRLRTFTEHVLRPLLGFTDSWDRFEWQARGSGHSHALFWIPTAPPLDQETEEARVKFAKYWGLVITAWNPDQLRLPDARNPASLAAADVTNTADQFAAFLNRLQMHSACRAPYCLRAKKGGDQPTCRFFFPRPLFTDPVVTKEINHKSWLFSPARNQGTLNQCAPAITMGWMANTDIQPPTTLRAVLSYIGKYVSKPEKSSTSYTELQAQVLPYVNDRAPLLSFVSKMLNKLIGERDWSAQEVSHILLQLPVQNSSRTVVGLDCHPEEVQRDLIVLESGEVAAQRSPLRRYQTRLIDTKNGNAALPDLSLFDCLRHWDWLTWRTRPRARPRVINYYPRYPNDPESPTYTDYCRVRLMLHHPFVDYADLFTVDGQHYESYNEAFQACRRSHAHPQDFYTDPEPDPEASDSESDEDPEEQAEGDHPLADFEAFARRRPQEDFTRIDLLDSLGVREMDRDYDWSLHVGRYDISPDIWDQVKAENPIAQAVLMDSSPDPLNVEQRKLYDTVVSQYSEELTLNAPLPRQLLLNVDGVAGSGKTFTLLKICARIQELAVEAGKQNPVFRAAPTGIAAFNIVGKTLHSLLRLPVKGKKSDLSAATLQSLQALFQDCRFLIIDEKSMIDIQTLSLIDDRLRAILPASSHLPFSGVNVLLCGDFFQLPPVGGQPLYSLKHSHVHAIKGHQLYRAFDRTIRLIQVMRQQGEDDMSTRFRLALSELRVSELSRESWQLLCSRTANQLSPTEVVAFDSALRLYFTTEEVRLTNADKLAGTNRPVKKITARHRGRNAAKATEDEADNLSPEISLCIGARVMLTTNLWTEGEKNPRLNG
ncbi:ATP-dependent DNA helicase PIF1 [Metarhizium guizhouense ARSEF 977]|uniref:ATP-dependent DNA helicase n=2 Tax=Opisthokonta TaxID=33154 RepID=A0A0B4G3I7_METGA|nr:ATP-dependent DNA helicase PIF1 [Metarhizium guizhouense ARSEF 977]